MSQVNFDTWQSNDGTKTYYGARAWVRFNGTGVVSILDSQNVSSITDHGTGDYSPNYTTSFTNGAYAIVGLATSNGTNAGDIYITSVSVGSARINFSLPGTAFYDASALCVAMFGS